MAVQEFMTEQAVAHQDSAWQQGGKILLSALAAALCAAGRVYFGSAAAYPPDSMA